MIRFKAVKIFFLFFFIFIYPVAAQQFTIQDISKKWIEIDRALTHENNKEQYLIDDIDGLYNLLKEFQSSDIYRMYRIAPFSRGEIAEVQIILDTVVSLRAALAAGDMEEVKALSSDISSALINWLVQDSETNRFSGTAYLYLLLVFLLFMAMSAVAVMFYYKAMLRSAAREEESSLYTQAFFYAQEEEKGRISRELHDTVAQDLRYLSLGMEKISAAHDAEQRKKLCEEAAALQSDLISRVRDICASLVPPDFRFQGLADAVRKLCFDYKNKTGIDCRAEIAENLDFSPFPEEKQLQIYRIVQEALTNVEKHSGAKEAIVILRSNDNEDLFIGISDDGKGMESPQSLSKLPSLGIKSMTKRAVLLGGTLEIRSEGGEGTLVCMKIPMKEKYDGSNVN
jgi:signal transduction histidine kinase